MDYGLWTIFKSVLISLCVYFVLKRMSFVCQRVIFFKEPRSLFLFLITQAVTTAKQSPSNIKDIFEILWAFVSASLCYCNAFSSDLQSSSITNSLFLISQISLTVIHTNRCLRATAATSVGTYAFLTSFRD